MTQSDQTGDLDLSVIIPAYNEEQNVLATLQACKGALDGIGIRYEIIVVNDASSDGTRAIAEAFAANDPTVRVINNSINLNVGIGILIGYKQARGRLVTHNAMDLPFNPADLASILPKFDNPKLGIVIVSRVDRSAHSLWRKITSIAHYSLVRLLFWTALPDMNFVQVCRRSIVNDIGVRARSPAFVTPETIMRIQAAGYDVEQVSATFHSRKFGKGSFGKPRDILWALADMASFRIERWRAPRPVGKDR